MFKKLLLIFSMSFALTVISAQNPFDAISIEEVPIPQVAQDAIDLQAPGARCYRVYICMAEPWWELVSVFGYDTPGNNFPGYITLADETTTRFYQDPFGGVNVSGINYALVPFFPQLAYDSFVTIRALHSTENTCLNSTPNVSANFENNGLSMDLTGAVGGSWYCPQDRAASYVGPDPVPGSWSTYIQNVPGSANRILIAQLTTNGIFNAQLSFQFRALNPDLTLDVTSYPDPVFFE